MDVICDTSFLIVLVSTPIQRIEKVENDLGGLRFLVPDIVIEELKRLERKSGPKKSMIARTAINIANVKLKVVSAVNSQYVDDAIVHYASEHGSAAATIDRKLKRRLLSNNIVVITVSNNKLRAILPPPREKI
jgi:uncharacterized protein